MYFFHTWWYLLFSSYLSLIYMIMGLYLAAAGECKGGSFMYLEVAGDEKLQSNQVLEPECKQESQVDII